MVLSAEYRMTFPARVRCHMFDGVASNRAIVSYDHTELRAKKRS